MRYFLAALLCLPGCRDDGEGGKPAHDGGRDASTGGRGAGGRSGAGGAGGLVASGGAPAVEAGAGGSADADADAHADIDAGSEGDAAVDSSLDATHHVDGAADSAATCVGDGGAGRGAYEWQVYYPDAFADHLAVDSTGAAIVTGSFSGSLTIDGHVLDSSGPSDIHLERVLPGGQVDWARRFGGTDQDYALNLVLDGQDRVFLSGLYAGAGNAGGSSFPTFAGTPGRYDAFLAAYSESGVHRWSVPFPSSGESGIGVGLAVDGRGSLLAAGQFQGGVSVLGEPLVAGGGWDAFFVRLDEPLGATGARLSVGAAGGDQRAGVAAWDGEDVWLAFDFQGSVDVPGFGTVTSAGGRDLLVLRVTRDGVVEDARRLGGVGDEQIIDGLWSGSALVLTGVVNGTDVELRPGEVLSIAGGDDVFVLSVAADLSVPWARVFGGTAGDRPREIAAGPCGELVLVGEFRESMILGGELRATPPEAPGATEIDVFVVKASADFVPVWARSFGGPSADRGLGVGIDRRGGVIFTAAFQSPINFGGGELRPGAGWSSALVGLDR